MFCPRCGREAQSGAAYCVYCGAALVAPPPADPAPVAPAPEPVPEPAPAGAAPTAAPPLAAPAPVRYAGFWRRFGAFWIDGILLWIAGALTQVSLGVELFGSDFATPQAMLSNLISVGIGWLYSGLLESGPRQATLGQLVVGIKVTDLAGRRVSFARATGRHFAQILSVLIVFMGYVMIAFTEKKQGLHDLVAGCLVVRAAD